MLSKYSNRLNNSNEHLANAVIATYINLKDNLSEKEISFIEHHLNKCNECKKRLNEMIEEDKEIDEERNLKITKLQDYKIAGLGFQESNRRSYIWAAAAMLIIAIGISIFYILQQGNEKVIVQNQKPLADSLMTEEKTPDDELTEEEKTTRVYNESDFAANSVLDNFISRNVRSESLVKIISPEAGDTSVTPIIFKWESNADREIILELVNNRNKIIIKKTLTENNFTYSKDLNPGLYYWKILIDNKLEAVGKFYIK